MIPWAKIIAGLAGLTGNPATAALLKLIALAVNAVRDKDENNNTTETVDAIQAALNELVDAIQGQHILPNIRLNEPRHEAALALAIDGDPAPAEGMPRHGAALAEGAT